MNVLLTDAKKLLKEEIKGKSSYDKFMALINPMYEILDKNLNDKTGSTLKGLYLLSIKSRLNDIYFDLRSLKKEVSYNDGIIDFGNVDTYDDYAIEDIFKNTHIAMETLKAIDN